MRLRCTLAPAWLGLSLLVLASVLRAASSVARCYGLPARSLVVWASDMVGGGRAARRALSGASLKGGRKTACWGPGAPGPSGAGCLWSLRAPKP